MNIQTEKQLKYKGIEIIVEQEMEFILSMTELEHADISRRIRKTNHLRPNEKLPET